MYGLEEKREEVLNFIHSIPEEETVKKPDSESWSMLEILEHLYLMEKVIIQQINQSIKKGEVKKTSSKPLHKTKNRTYKVQAPESVRPNGRFTSTQEALEGLEHTREATLFLIHNKDRQTLRSHTYPHPAFGDLDLEQWVEFIGWHELRHLDQMKEVKRLVDN
ncbi:DinB family protein [Halobacillus salinarum]|uniref:DinB family protein n=1 Tax=Halobacillus salinarum TaxID=2932257 RepID=A0ABY4EHH1_9BACI|nr:DinB family protein [Halobacillus salinarum]UOQ43911.1 DinB family protein [Halobacillus salinarum]